MLYLKSTNIGYTNSMKKKFKLCLTNDFKHFTFNLWCEWTITGLIFTYSYIANIHQLLLKPEVQPAAVIHSILLKKPQQSGLMNFDCNTHLS